MSLIDHGGLSGMLEALPVRAKGSTVACIGVVIDAGVDPAARWQQITEALDPIGYALPVSLEAGGVIIEQAGRPRIGVWAMPDNTSNGGFDEFILSLIPDDDVDLTLAREVIDRRPAGPSPKPAKATVSVWLALQDDPGLPVDAALNAHRVRLNARGTLAEAFAEWARRLFTGCGART